jgi:hypothetical protein
MWKDDVAVDPPLRGTVHSCRLAKLLGHPAESREEKSHDVAGERPHSWDRERGSAPCLPEIPLVAEESETELVEQEVESGRAVAGRRVHQPPPDDSRGDEGDRHREQVNRPEHPLTLDALVEQEGKHRTHEQRSPDEGDGEEQRVVQIDDPPRIRRQGGRLVAGGDPLGEVVDLAGATGKEFRVGAGIEPRRLL